MDVLFFLLFLVFLVALIVGIIRPGSVLRWGSEEKKTRKNVLKYFGIGMILFFVLFAANASNSSVGNASTNKSQTTNVEQNVASDKEVAKNLDTKIEALGNVNSIKLDKATDVQAIRKSYEELTSDQKSLVTKLSVLTAAEDKITNLQATADKIAADKAAEEKAAADKIAAEKEAAEKVAADQAAAQEAVAVNSTPAQSQNNEYTVYITKTGKKYHRSGCRYLSRSQISISKSNAISEGYTPCSVCNP